MLGRTGRAFDQAAFARLAEHGWVPLPPRPSCRAADPFAGWRLGCTESPANEDREGGWTFGTRRDRYLQHRMDSGSIISQPNRHERRKFHENDQTILAQ